jgi:hypothetical protein
MKDGYSFPPSDSGATGKPPAKNKLRCIEKLTQNGP